jgi:hypothetical protein
MQTFRLALMLIVLFFVCGCAPPTGVVKGTVTFQGRPLEAGQVRFEPTSGAGGTQGGEITKGEFLVKGLQPGKFKVRVDGEYRPPKITAPGGPESQRRMTDAEILAQSDPLPVDTMGRDQEIDVVVGEQRMTIELTSPSAK